MKCSVCVCVHVDFLFFLPEMVNKVEYNSGGVPSPNSRERLSSALSIAAAAQPLSARANVTSGRSVNRKWRRSARAQHDGTLVRRGVSARGVYKQSDKRPARTVARRVVRRPGTLANQYEPRRPVYT